MGDDQEVQIVFEDQPNNDFNALFKAVNGSFRGK